MCFCVRRGVMGGPKEFFDESIRDTGLKQRQSPETTNAINESGHKWPYISDNECEALFANAFNPKPIIQCESNHNFDSSFQCFQNNIAKSVSICSLYW